MRRTRHQGRATATSEAPRGPFPCARCEATITPPPAHESGGTGYGITAAGERVCYACCATATRAEMDATGRATLYFTGGGRDGALPEVSDWPGVLRFAVTGTRDGRRGKHTRVDVWFAVGRERWHGTVTGDTQILRARREA